jgi:hypothetical protein
MHNELMSFFLTREVVNFYKFLNTLDEILSSREKELIVSLADSRLAAPYHDEERRNEMIELRVEAERAKGFTNLFRQSFLTSLYSFMELWLMRQCHLDSKRRDRGESYKAIKREKGIQKARKYMSSVMGSKYPFDSSQDWIWITNFQLLRDCIVHRQGSLTGFSNFEVDPTLSSFVNNQSDLSLFGATNNQIFIEQKFCLTALQTVHRFMLDVLTREDNQ